MTVVIVDENTTVRVSNLAPEVDEHELRQKFKEHGYITRTFLATDPETGESKGFAFITYKTKEEADRAIEKLNGEPWHHLILCVERAKPSKRKI